MDRCRKAHAPRPQRISRANYEEPRSRLLAQSPEIIAETYGIPREGPFYTTEKPRAFYKLPFCHERKQFQEELDYDKIELFYRKSTPSADPRRSW